MYSEEMYAHGGAVYIQEEGELRCINYSHKAIHPSVKTPPRLKELPLGTTAFHLERKDHFVHTLDSEGSIRYTAKSLLDLCLLYVAENVEHIESLVGFPEEMAARLFVVAEEKKKFSDQETGSRALKVFCDAYEDLVLRSLCLRNRFSVVFEKLEEIKTFQSLRCLDLHGCKFGDSQEIFEYLTSGHLSRSLSQLFLGANSLSDAGIQKLTAPVRIMKTGLQNLELLDLSYNPITERALGYLACFQKLRGLDLSETLIKPGTALNGLLWRKMRLVSSDSPLKAFCHSCKTVGWAQEVIRQWEVDAVNLQKIRTPRTNAHRFYGVEKMFHEKLNFNAVNNKILRLQFYRPDPEFDFGISQVKLDRNTDGKMDLPSKTDLKRKLSPESEAAALGSKVAKRQSKPSFSAEDLDLLNSY
ncbi:hypothetical protein ACEWY4_006715 [Coilia grayii]|uniref:Leucine-rich repeat-containing protein 42 n=1 Tax=Coilia grayii TaxID=363190 RepID=A0ABD1KEK4_9TELE